MVKQSCFLQLINNVSDYFDSLEELHLFCENGITTGPFAKSALEWHLIPG